MKLVLIARGKLCLFRSHRVSMIRFFASAMSRIILDYKDRVVVALLAG